MSTFSCQERTGALLPILGRGRCLLPALRSPGTIGVHSCCLCLQWTSWKESSSTAAKRLSITGSAAPRPTEGRASSFSSGTAPEWLLQVVWTAAWHLRTSRKGSQGRSQGIVYGEWCKCLFVHYLHSCDPMDCNPPGSSVHGILQAEILEWVVTPFPRESSKPRDRTQVSCIAGGFFTAWATKEAHHLHTLIQIFTWTMCLYLF